MKLQYKDSSFLSNEEIQKGKEILSPYLKKIKIISQKNTYEEPESSACLPSDNEMKKNVEEVVAKKSAKKLKYIIDIGIGGSNLGTKAIYDGLLGYADQLELERFPKLLFLDTNDSEYLKKAIAFIKKIQDKEELLINIISKSGGTTETIVNAEVLLGVFLETGKEILDRVVVTTDRNSPLWAIAVEKNITTLALPKQVGGRYSVLSAVGLFPLMAAGIDVGELLKGALSMREECYNEENSPALISAIFLGNYYKRGKNIHDLFIFHPELESLGKWYRQLMGESLGKDGKGITPTVSVGSTDLHSVGQLYLGGPKDKTTCFLSACTSEEVRIPEKLMFPLIQDIQGKNVSEVMTAIQEGTMKAFSAQQIPTISVVLNDISAFSIGEFMQYKMIEMMLLGQLLGVNAFNQPHVELYKKETKNILSGQ